MIALQFDDGGITLALAHAPQVSALLIQKWMTDVVMHLVGAVQKNIGDGGLIGRRTGNLARSLRFEVTPTPAGIDGTVWPDPDKGKYFNIQEFGGTIVPNKSQFLAIPLAAMLTGNGVARGTARQVKDDPGAFGFLGTFISKGVIFGRTGKKSPTLPLFALKSSVMLPGRHYMETTLTQETTWIADRLEQLTGEMVQVFFGEAPA